MMIRSLRFCCVLLAACSGIAHAAESSTNKASAAVTNLPPLTLAQALRADIPGTYKFTPAWTGLCHLVVATGVATNPEPAKFATNRPIVRFDAVVVAAKGNIGNVGPKGVARIDKDGGYTALHTLRGPLPSDSDIRAAAQKNLAALERLLGPSQGFPAQTGIGETPLFRSEWSFAALHERSIETLRISALAANGSGKIESLEVRRGSATVEIKEPKKS
jgi:hypothetical protein